MNSSQSSLALLCALLAGTLSAQGAGAPGGGADTPDTQSLKELSIEELMDLDVTIASRSEESLSSIPGAVYVLTGDEIRVILDGGTVDRNGPTAPMLPTAGTSIPKSRRPGAGIGGPATAGA